MRAEIRQACPVKPQMGSCTLSGSNFSLLCSHPRVTRETTASIDEGGLHIFFILTCIYFVFILGGYMWGYIFLMHFALESFRKSFQWVDELTNTGSVNNGNWLNSNLALSVWDFLHRRGSEQVTGTFIWYGSGPIYFSSVKGTITELLELMLDWCGD